MKIQSKILGAIQSMNSLRYLELNPIVLNAQQLK